MSNEKNSEPDTSFMDETVTDMVRRASKEVLGLNSTFVDDDLHLLAALAKRACKAGLIEGMHPDTAKIIREKYGLPEEAAA